MNESLARVAAELEAEAQDRWDYWERCCKDGTSEGQTSWALGGCQAAHAKLEAFQDAIATLQAYGVDISL